MTRSTSANGNGDTSSWSLRSSAMMSGGHDVGPRREQLAELDERRPELVEHLAQPAAAVGDRLRRPLLRRRSSR